MSFTQTLHRSTSIEGRALILGLLLMIGAGFSLLPVINHFAMTPRSSRKNSCIAQLKQIDSAKEQWAMDNHRPKGTLVYNSDLVGATLYLRRSLYCPSAGTYYLNAVGDNPTCDKKGHTLP